VTLATVQERLVGAPERWLPGLEPVEAELVQGRTPVWAQEVRSQLSTLPKERVAEAIQPRRKWLWAGPEMPKRAPALFRHDSGSSFRLVRIGCSGEENVVSSVSRFGSQFPGRDLIDSRAYPDSRRRGRTFLAPPYIGLPTCNQ
jgi:hypothetical protein